MIIKGAKSEVLLIERAYTFELIVNLKMAKPLGIKIPQQVPQHADKVIEWSTSGCLRANRMTDSGRIETHERRARTGQYRSVASSLSKKGAE
jgi:hypothetical protein